MQTLLITLSLLIVLSIAQNENIQFTVPDLSAEVMIDKRRVYVDAYRVKNQSRWVSVGSPYIVGVYEFTPEAVRFTIRILDEEQRQALVAVARQLNPNTPITALNFGIIPLQVFTCETMIFVQPNYVAIRGDATDFHSTDIAVEVLYPESSEKRQALTARIKQNDRIVWKCTLSAAGQVQKANTLTVTSQQMQQIVQSGALFGNGDETFVTRQQLNTLAQKVRTELHVEEVYELEGEDFDRDFINRLIAMAPLQEVGIDEALGQLSKFGATMNEKDIQPSEIKKEMSNRLTVKSENGKQYISTLDESKREGSSSNSLSVSGQASGSADLGFLSAGVDISMDYTKTNADSWKNSDKSARQQLTELNKASKDHVQWEIEGTRIVPKSLNVAKMSRAAIIKDLSFSISKTRVIDAQYKKKFDVQAAISNETNLDRVSIYDRLKALDDRIKLLQDDNMKGLDERMKSMQMESCRLVARSCPSILPVSRMRTIYAGTGKGQLWISTDSGLTWSRRLLSLPNNYRIDSIFASGSKIYAATGFGLHVSETDGQSWTKDPQFGNGDVYRVTNSGSTLYAVSCSVLYISKDEAKTWTKSVNALCVAASGSLVFGALNNKSLFTSFNNGNNWTERVITTLRADNFVYEIVAQFGKILLTASLSGLHLSENDGQTWENSQSLALACASCDVYRVVALNNRTLYAGTYNSRGFYKSIDGGKTWNGPVDCGWDSKTWCVYAFKALEDRLYLATKKGLYELEFSGSDPDKCWPLIEISDTSDYISSIFVQT